MTRHKHPGLASSAVFGAILLLFGTLLLLNNVNIIEADSIWRYWPFVIVAVGLNKIINAGSQKGASSGIWLVFLGIWLFVSIHKMFGLSFWETWPMLLIAWGVSEIWKALAQQHSTVSKENTHAQ